ncbi:MULTISPECIES: carbohydrate ABC transporter permease [Streptomyces]|uniref:carbohydrate ABC transporter permease n=1 Tax=Streptomyces TaxID=1883 RepID=UPI001884C4F4|nr:MULTISPECIES: sugar ABC transporter permease [Streptomyces]MBZ6129903.1 sugar ABC transporter permease [Streptomyces olivaceus]MBZ6141909.1 sugar ABC transporter permease [Streptomyces olivaceus]MBZ6165861.1 sugar ABC transporter permease [Streptomyces olivaceus]MBZ6174529.1 sugar ABC transporter permease [Streptomyces olivaceus]MBZ6180708.1 sugar ABC transporter permease [Streptomyces olivaceus]
MSTSTTDRRPPTAAGGPAGPRRPAPRLPLAHAWQTTRERLAAGGFMAPAVLLVTLFLLAPFVWTVYRSFFSDTRTAPFSWFDNYALFASDPALARSIQNTLMWVVGTVALPFVLGLAIAVMTNAGRLSRLARLCVVLPYALSGSAVAVVWNFMLTTDGAVNQVLTTVGLDSVAQGWLLTWPGNTVVMILANAWQATGVAVILFLVGLQSIPPETLEAGSLDGANGWQQFRHIVLPQLRPVSIIVIGMSLVNGLKSFDLIWVLTQGGPGRATETLAVSMYNETFLELRPGAGAAIAVVLTVIVLAASWVYLRRQLDVKGG